MSKDIFLYEVEKKCKIFRDNILEDRRDKNNQQSHTNSGVVEWWNKAKYQKRKKQNLKLFYETLKHLRKGNDKVISYFNICKE